MLKCTKHAIVRTNLANSFQSVALNVTEYSREYQVSILIESHRHLELQAMMSI